MALWGNKDSKTAGGTVSIASSGVVTGSSTFFTTQAKVGNTIKTSADVEYQIVSITSNTVAKVIMGTNNGNGTVTTASGLSYTLSEKPTSVAHQSADSFSMGRSNLVFGVDATEAVSGGDNVSAVSVASGKTRYLEVPGVTFSGGGGSSAAATASISGGAVSAITVTNTGTGYTSVPTVVVAKPRRTISGTITENIDTIPYTAHGLVANEEVKYNNGGGASATGLVSTTSYFVANAGLTANAFEVKAAATTNSVVAPLIDGTGGAGSFSCTSGTLAINDRVKITGTNTGTGTITGYATGNTYKVSAVTGSGSAVTAFTLTTEAGAAIATSAVNAATFTGLTFTGETVIDISGPGTTAQFFEIQATADQATATAARGDSAVGGSAHAGWVKRTVGTGGRAGRVQYETLVAMGSITGDQSDDVQFRDS